MNEDELKEENTELHADYEALADENTKLRDQNARLKAEVSRLKMEESKLLTLCETYEGDLERLRKAGDVMAEALSLNDDVFDNQEKKEAQAAWNAAKEGKQP